MNISDIVDELKRLGNQAYAAYVPIVTQLCEGEVSESEISHHFDYMLDIILMHIGKCMRAVMTEGLR